MTCSGRSGTNDGSRPRAHRLSPASQGVRVAGVASGTAAAALSVPAAEPQARVPGLAQGCEAIGVTRSASSWTSSRRRAVGNAEVTPTDSRAGTPASTGSPYSPSRSDPTASGSFLCGR